MSQTDSDHKWLLPSDATLLAHNSVHEASPSTCCATRTSSSSTASGALSSDEETFDTSASVDSDSDTEHDADPAPDFLATIERHLGDMNTAAEALNEAQGALRERTRKREQLEREWAVESVSLAKSVGMDSVAKATPYYQQLHRCEAAREAMEQASKEYQTPVCMEDTATSQLKSKYAARCSKYHEAKELLKVVRAQSGVTTNLLHAVLPYFDAEDEYRVQVAEATLAVQKLEQFLDSAKQRYRSAVQSLEALSEQEHRQRASRSSNAATGLVDA
eukprot:TRINITY_DN45299_c0_g1_i1.p1 TRINITY_DN45299_c0_g1~~TRINITY_DN45299_c0_g1_i1.p1  ORF type:complete len:291 (-),score=66.91 TRINITY_DN45299_c0_g1_i1:239-1063(-)